MARRIPTDVLAQSTRSRIHEVVVALPGIHLRLLQRRLGFALGTLEYHLHQMIRAGEIVTRAGGRYTSYFPKDGLDRRDRDYLYFLRQEIPSQVARCVVENPGISFRALVAKMPRSSSTVSFHIKKLLTSGILQWYPDGRERRYVAPEPDRVRRLIDMDTVRLAPATPRVLPQQPPMMAPPVAAEQPMALPPVAVPA